MEHSHQNPSSNATYGMLLLMSILSCIAMYFLMYAMVDSTQNVIHNVKHMAEQRKILEAIIDNWKGNSEQTDDILIVGFKVSQVGVCTDLL